MTLSTNISSSATQHQKLACKIKSNFSHSTTLRSFMDWEKRLEAGRLDAGKIKVACESRIIVRIRLPAIGGVTILSIEMKVHSQNRNTITACSGAESTNAFISRNFDGSSRS